MWFSHNSISKESACNAGDPRSIPGPGRYPGKRNGNPLLYSCLWNPMDRGACQATVHGVTTVRHDLASKPPPPSLYKRPVLIICSLFHLLLHHRSSWHYSGGDLLSPQSWVCWLLIRFSQYKILVDLGKEETSKSKCFSHTVFLRHHPWLGASFLYIQLPLHTGWTSKVPTLDICSDPING